jgi:hypothetical protein
MSAFGSGASRHDSSRGLIAVDVRSRHAQAAGFFTGMVIRMWLHRLSSLVCLLIVAIGAGSSSPHAATVPDVLKESIAFYGSLTSYSDTGTIRQEMPGIVEEANLTTYFRRATRDFYFDFQMLRSRDPKTGFTIDLSANRTVFWMFNGNMQSYNLLQKTHQQITAQTEALQHSSYATRGTSILVPSLLYPKSNLPGTVLQVQDAQLAGFEDINQQRCHKVVGTAFAYYNSGARTGERPVTVWIDAQTRLIRRVFEDTPKNQATGYSRLTITFEPRANPSIADARFQFKPPAR